MSQRYTDAGIEEEHAARDRDRLADRVVHGPCDPLADRSLGRRDHDRELVGTQPDDQVVIAQPRTQPVPDDAQDLVAVEVPIGVVDGLELVEVDQHDGSGTARGRLT